MAVRGSRRRTPVPHADTTRFTEAAARARLAAARHRLAELEAGTRREQVDAQQAEIRRLEGSLERLNAQRADSELQAPFAGTVGRRYLDEGAVPQPGTPVLRLVETGALEAVIGIPHDLTARFPSDCDVTLTVGDRPLAAVFVAALPELDEATRTRKVLFRVTDPVGDLTPGQLVRLEVTEPVQQDGFWVPLATLVRGGRGLWSVYTVREAADRPGLVVMRSDVEVLWSEAERALVRGTLRAGDQVVASGTHRVVNGQAVRIVTNEDPE